MSKCFSTFDLPMPMKMRVKTKDEPMMKLGVNVIFVLEELLLYDFGWEKPWCKDWDVLVGICFDLSAKNSTAGKLVWFCFNSSQHNVIIFAALHEFR